MLGVFKEFNSILNDVMFPMFSWKEINQIQTKDNNNDLYSGNINSKEFIDYLIKKIKENKINSFKVTSDPNGTLSIFYNLNTNKNDAKLEKINDENVYMGDDKEDKENNNIIIKFIEEDEFNKKFKDLIDLRDKYIEKNNVKKNVVKIILGIDGKEFDIREIIDSKENDIRYFNLADISNLFSIIDKNISSIIKEVAMKLPNELKTFKYDEKDKSIYVYVNYKFIIEIMKNIDVDQYFDICYDIWTNLIINKSNDFEKLNVRNKFQYYHNFINMLKSDKKIK